MLHVWSFIIHFLGAFYINFFANFFFHFCDFFFFTLWIKNLNQSAIRINIKLEEQQIKQAHNCMCVSVHVSVLRFLNIDNRFVYLQTLRRYTYSAIESQFTLHFWKCQCWFPWVWLTKFWTSLRRAVFDFE